MKFLIVALLLCFSIPTGIAHGKVSIDKKLEKEIDSTSLVLKIFSDKAVEAFESGDIEKAKESFANLVILRVVHFDLMPNVYPKKTLEKNKEKIDTLKKFEEEIFNNYALKDDRLFLLSDNYEDRVKSFVKNTLKDPDSAKFRNITAKKSYHHAGISPFGWIITGEINAKNSFGGYGGFSKFDCFMNGEDVNLCNIGDDVFYSEEVTRKMKEKSNK